MYAVVSLHNHLILATEWATYSTTVYYDLQVTNIQMLFPRFFYFPGLKSLP